MVKRLFLLSLLVLALCGASTICFAGGPAGGCAYMPPPPGLPPLCGPAATNYSQVTEVITPVPAQLRRVRVVAPYLSRYSVAAHTSSILRKPTGFSEPYRPWPL